MSDRRRYVVSVTEEEGEVLEALAHFAGYTGRVGAWIGDEVRGLVARHRSDEAVRAALQARADYRVAQAAAVVERPTRHRFGVIDGGAGLPR